MQDEETRLSAACPEDSEDVLFGAGFGATARSFGHRCHREDASDAGAASGEVSAGNVVSERRGACAGDYAAPGTGGELRAGGRWHGSGCAGGGYAARGAAGVRHRGGDDNGRGSAATDGVGVERAEAGPDSGGTGVAGA